MKRAAILSVILGLAVWAGAQTPPASGTPAAAPPVEPASKRPPQAKNKAEFDAYSAAAAVQDPFALEKAANDFAAKFPDSELRILLFRASMQAYGRNNGGDKTLEMGRKALALDPDDPEALLGVAGELGERTRDSDLDKGQRYDEAVKMAQKAIQTVDTDLVVPPNTPQERIDAYKADRKSFAYSVIGLVAYKREQYADAETNFAKSLELYPNDAVTAFRLALAQDKQNKYEAGLQNAGKAVALAKDNPEILDLAGKECDRLAQLSGKPKPASCAAAPAAKN
jgi:tetratricopeptide (TPR) repeat protein